MANTLRGLSLARLTLLPLILLVGLGTAALAEEGAESGYDKVWAAAQLYTGDSDSFFQAVQFSGRLQVDLAFVDSGDDEHGELNIRRFRVGLKTRFSREFIFHLEGEFNPQEADPVYTRLTDAYLAWSPRDAITTTVGKHSVGFTLDGMTSSKSLLTIDRSNLSNNIWFSEEYIPGISVKGETKKLIYFVGAFSSGDKDAEFGDFKGGQFVLLTLGHDFADRLGVREAILRLNLVDNEPDPENGFTRPLEQIGSLNFSIEGERWGVRVDTSVASGYGDQSDLWGMMLMPFHNLTDSLQLVARYTHVESDEDNGVRLARYESTIADGRGDEYREIYLGLNYYLYGHKLKLQNGLQWVDMEDQANDGGEYSGWSWTTALRVSW